MQYTSLPRHRAMLPTAWPSTSMARNSWCVSSAGFEAVLFCPLFIDSLGQRLRPCPTHVNDAIIKEMVQMDFILPMTLGVQTAVTSIVPL